MKRLLARHSPLIILAVLCLILAAVSADFRTSRNLQMVALQTAVISIIATGEVLIILTAGIDLSVGSVAALGGVVAALTMKGLGNRLGVEDPTAWESVGAAATVFLGVLSGAAAGGVCGFINGMFVTRGRIPPFIATLGMMMAARGVALLLTKGVSVSGLPPAFLYLGGQKGWYIPVSLAVAFAGVLAVVLSQTRFGRALYAIGGQLNAARLSGINVDRDRLIAYTLCGLLSGFAGVVLASRTAGAQPTAAEMYELFAIAACVIGGASLMGGEGGCTGALAGALIMRVLANFCELVNIQVFWQQILIGVLIIGIVCYDSFRKRRAGLLKDG
jgi:ribose/xylose/arabinose/galactoside ABC-type transport system permease subunit